jgi:hypothetical protein
VRYIIERTEQNGRNVRTVRAQQLSQVETPYVHIVRILSSSISVFVLEEEVSRNSIILPILMFLATSPQSLSDHYPRMYAPDAKNILVRIIQSIFVEI